MSEIPFLEFSGLSKRFGGTQALDGVSFTIRKGEVRGLAGENGAGKSTLIKILCGVYSPDAGEIYLDGEKISPRTPAEAEKLGISVFHQEIPVCLNLSVAANVFLAPDMPGRFGMPNWREMYERCEEIFEALGEKIDPEKPVRECSAAEKQMVLLARVLSKKARLIVLDEPTTALTPPDVQRLFSVIERLKGMGITFIFVSHMLEEIMSLSDRITVLRNGQYIGTLDRPEFDTEKLTQMIVGHSVVSVVSRKQVDERPVILEAREIGVGSSVSGISFRLRRGEILGIAGLQGSGRSALVRCLFGSPPPDRGRLLVDGVEVSIRSPLDSIKLGIGYVPEDRKILGLFRSMDVKRNLGIAHVDRMTRLGFLDMRAMKALAEEMAKLLRISMPGVDAPITSLSGGNQQKVLFARWLAIKPRVLVMHEPTRGVDVGAKAEIRRLIVNLADEGYSFIVASSDLDELLAISDRILVMRHGKIATELTRGQATKERIILSATTG